MRSFLTFILTASILAHSCVSFAESVNHAPPFQIYQNDPDLKELLEGKGGNNLCFPSALAHRIFYDQNYAHPPLKNFSLSTTSGHLDIKAAVQTFAKLCHTGFVKGTPQNAKVACITQYFEQKGYHPQVFAVGKAARGTPASPGAHNEFRPVQISDLRKYISQDYGVILHVGWLKFDPIQQAWVESGSHSLNAYGYDYDPSWGEDRIVLKVANPSINYSKRASPQYYDSVVISGLNRKPGVRYPSMVNLTVRGPGFDNSKRLPVLEDLFVFSP
jgi:hypothetical protein